MKKCGFFTIPDLFYDEEGIDCQNEATHTSCNYGDVCEDHKCRCSKKIEIKKETRRETKKPVREIGTNGIIDFLESVDTEKINFDLKTINVKLHNIRIIDHPLEAENVLIQTLEDGEWVTMGGIQSFKLEITADDPTPKVIIERYMI